MKDIVKYARMLDLYGGILTEKQYGMLDSYYCSDLTMEEIAQNYEISKQAVHYAIKNAEEKIQKLESQLHILEKYDMLEKQLADVRDKALTDECSTDTVAAMLTEIIDEL